ncbi:MAG: hypothetical protein LM561_01230 [Desulfurococcaceae archaeon]|nr:hypothetical protein [Desulfurococcaceae archaeon]
MVKTDLLSDVMKFLCSSKASTLQDLMKEFKLTEAEAEALLSTLLGEGLLIKVEAGIINPCVGCPLNMACKIKTTRYENTTTHYRLSNSGLKFCEKLKT